MDFTKSYTINGSLFQEFLGLLGKMTRKICDNVTKDRLEVVLEASQG